MLPISEFIFPPNLLRERLSDLSFNWNLAGHALPFGTFINGIDYAIFLAAMIMLALARGIASAPSRKTLAWLGGALVLGATTLLTLKGSGWLALAGGLGVLVIYFAPRSSRPTALILLAMGVLALILILPFLGVISDRLTFLVERELGDSRNLGRLSIWSSLLPALIEHPLFGFGMNNRPPLQEVLRTLKFGVFGTYPVSPESAYVQVLIETGALGFIALMSFFGMTIAHAVKSIRSNSNAIAHVGILAALAALWAGNLTVSAFTTDQNGLLMGLLIGLVFADWNAG
jgi:O-antigen ligase